MDLGIGLKLLKQATPSREVTDNGRQPWLDLFICDEVFSCARVGSFKIVDQFAKRFSRNIYLLFAVSVLAKSIREKNCSHLCISPF
jgi:hypothetical protein